MSAPELVDASNRLARLPGMRSQSVAEAVAALSQRYRTHRLEIGQATHGQLDFKHHAIDCGKASLNLLRYGPELVVDAGSFDTFYMIEFPLRGGVDILYGDRRVSSRVGSGLVLSPGAYIRSNWHEDTTQIMLRLDRTFVEGAWQRRTGSLTRQTPVFRPELDLGSPEGRRIARLIGMMVAEQIEAGATALAPMPLVNAVLETLFDHVPATPVPTFEALAGGPVPYYVGRFRRLLDDPAELPQPVGVIAARIGISQRTLSASMRRFTGFTPHEYLMMRRMEHARVLLERSDLPVSGIARAVGYAHSGRFAAAFRAYFGTNPSRLSVPDGM
jgi:AraC-like DNA-binding protein